MKQFLKFCAFILLIVGLFLLALGYYENYVFRKGSYYKSQWINKIKERSFDAVFIGNSRGALFELTDTTTSYINLAEDGSGLKTTYCQLYLFYKNGNKAAQVLYDIDVYTLRKLDDSKRSSRWIPFFNDSTIYSTLKDEHTAFKYYSVLPALTYATFKYDWNLAALANNALGLKASPYGKYGFSYNCASYVDHSPRGVSNYDSLPPNLFWLDKILTLCRENDSKLILFTSPYYQMLDEPVANPKFDQALIERDLILHDYSRVYLNDKKYFRDNRHLNCDGVHAFEKIIREEILQQTLKSK